ncbi:MAG: hypothetical protein HZC41_18325 [Chloroflexi bacterium]|nr:hypothetical protein [Chloroflexota bacterium]
MSDPLLPIREAIRRGDKKCARELLRPLLKNPTAETWYIAAQSCDSRAKALDCLRRALRVDPTYEPARRALAKLEMSGLDLPPLEALVAVPPTEVDTSLPPEFVPLRPSRSERKRSVWTTIGCAGSILLSLSSAYFVLTVLGSPVAGQLRAAVDRLTGGSGGQTGEGTPVFGLPSDDDGQPGAGSEAADSGVSGGETSGGAVRGASGGFIVKPNKTVELKRNQPVSDVLDAGYAHEYTFEAQAGEELAVGVQFFSPNAKRVGANVAVLDPGGVNAESRCQRDSILSDGSSVAFICQVNKTGTWKLHIFGRDGESTGVYVVTYERM